MSPSVRTLNLPALAAGVTVILWALAFIAIRSAAPVLAPGVLALLRLAVAVTALVVIAGVGLLRPRSGGARPNPFRPPRGRARWLVAGYGVAWFGGYMVALNWAERHIDAGTAALLVNFAPILVAVFAGILLGEGFATKLWVGMGIAFTGIVLITFGGSGPQADWLGVGLALLAAVLYALGVLLQKVALQAVDAVTATFWGAVVGLVAMLPFLPAAVGEVSRADLGVLAWVIFLGVGPTAIAFTTWAYALARTDAGAMAATTLVIPALVILLSWVILAEVPTPVRIIGGLLCLIGVAISRGLLGLHGFRLTRRNRSSATETEAIPEGIDMTAKPPTAGEIIRAGSAD